MGVVVNFVLIEFSGHANHEAQPFFIVFLAEHGSHSGVRGVGVAVIWLVSVREGEHNVAEKAFLEIFESTLLCGSPVPNPFSSQGGKRGGDSSELRKELLVEATETEEGRDVLRILGYRLIRNCLKFFGYRPDSLASHDEAYKLGF